DVELAALEVRAVDVGDLELAARRGLEARGDLQHAVVVEIETHDGVARARALRLLLDSRCFSFCIECNDAIALGILDRIGKYSRAALPLRRLLEEIHESVAVEQVVAQHQRHGIAADEFSPDDERLSDAIGFELLFIAYADAPL